MNWHKLLGALVLILCTVAPENLYADLYLPPEGASLPSGVIQEFVAPRKWDSEFAGLPAEVTYSFVTSLTATYDETALGGGSGTLSPITEFMPVGALDEIRSAFNAWSAVSNITFTEVLVDSGNNYNTLLGDSDADIRIAGHALGGPFGTLAHAATSSFGTTPLLTIATAWIDFDIAENWAVDSIDGSNSAFDIFQVAAHEIGHAIGLGHEETNVALMNPIYSEAFTGLQPDDISGAQFLYGAVAVPEPSAFLFGGLVCGVLGVRYSRQRKS